MCVRLRATASGERRSQQRTHDQIAYGGQVYHQTSSGYVRIWNNTVNKTLRGGAVFPRWAVCLAALLLAWPSPARSTPFRPGAVLIKLRSSGALAAAQAMLPSGAALGAAIGRDTYAVQVPVGQEQRYARRLAALPQVAYAQLDHAVAAQQAPDDPRYAEQWGMPHIGMPGAWEVITDTSKLTIAVIDTGIKDDHPDLAHEISTTLQTSGLTPGNLKLEITENAFVHDLTAAQVMMNRARAMGVAWSLDESLTTDELDGEGARAVVLAHAREELRLHPVAHGVAGHPLVLAQQRLDREVVDAPELLHGSAPHSRMGLKSVSWSNVSSRSRDFNHHTAA